MSKEVLISMLRQGNTGTEILSILDAITSDAVSEEQEGNMPTLDVIEFWWIVGEFFIVYSPILFVILYSCNRSLFVIRYSSYYDCAVIIIIRVTGG